MVKVTAVNYIKAECIEDFLAVTKELVEKTNTLDSGCIRYELYRDTKDSTRFMMLEEWQDYESLDNHMKAKHFTDLVPRLGDFAAKPSELSVFEKVY